MQLYRKHPDIGQRGDLQLDIIAALAKREAQVREQEREAAKGLVEAFSILIGRLADDAAEGKTHRLSGLTIGAMVEGKAALTTYREKSGEKV